MEKQQIRGPVFAVMSVQDFSVQYPSVEAEILQYLQAGFVPAIFRAMVQANAPIGWISWQAVREILCKGRLPRVLKEMVLATVASSKNCHYCATAHYAIGCRLGVPRETFLTALNSLDQLRPLSLRMAIQFALDVTHRSQIITPSYYANLHASGVAPQDCAELLAMAGLANLLTVYADGLMVQPDPEFAAILEQVA